MLEAIINYLSDELKKRATKNSESLKPHNFVIELANLIVDSIKPTTDVEKSTIEVEELMAQIPFPQEDIDNDMGAFSVDTFLKINHKLCEYTNQSPLTVKVYTQKAWENWVLLDKIHMSYVPNWQPNNPYYSGPIPMFCQVDHYLGCTDQYVLLLAELMNNLPRLLFVYGSVAYLVYSSYSAITKDKKKVLAFAIGALTYAQNFIKVAWASWLMSVVVWVLKFSSNMMECWGYYNNFFIFFDYYLSFQSFYNPLIAIVLWWFLAFIRWMLVKHRNKLI